MRRITIEIASPDEYDDLVAEIDVEDQFRFVFSQEPNEPEVSVAIFNVAASKFDANQAAYGKKDIRRLITVKELRELLDRGVEALRSLPRGNDSQ
ncbi:MAG TPA: hypothetical protein VNH64_11910 [Parvularculaceae bacterium]|nr:hypothetical protein [Parvularculaceae bacterium]